MLPESHRWMPWISVGNAWIGYVPESAWGGHFKKGANATDYGEVFDNAENPTTKMGDGQYGASAGATTMTQILAILPGEVVETTGYHATQTYGAFYSPGHVTPEKPNGISVDRGRIRSRS